MADETTQNGTAQETGTAQDGQSSTPAASTPDPRIAELERQLQQFKSQQGREAAELRRQLQAAQAQTRQYATAGMDDSQRIVFERDEAIRFANETNQRLEAMQLQQARLERISELSRKTGVPFEELDKAQSPDDLAMLVHEWNAKQSETKITQQVEKRTEKREANAVDLGGGGAKRGTSGIEEKFKAAIASGDVREVAKLRKQLQQQE